MNRKRLIRILVTLFAVAAAYFALRSLASDWRAAQDAIASADVALLLASLATAASGMVVIALVWGVILDLMARRHLVVAAVPWYFMGEVAKYVPGSAWSIIGRGELATRGGVPRRTSYLSVVSSLLLLYGTAALLSAWTLAIAEVTDRRLLIGLLVTSVILVGLLLTPTVSAWALAHLRNMTRHAADITLPPFVPMMLVIGGYAIAWAAIGASTALVATSLGIDGSMYTIASATVVSWLAGFAVVVAPGGLGIREAVFVALCGLEAADAALVAVVARLVFVAIDVIGALLALIVTRALRRRSPRTTGGGEAGTG